MCAYFSAYFAIFFRLTSESLTEVNARYHVAIAITGSATAELISNQSERSNLLSKHNEQTNRVTTATTPQPYYFIQRVQLSWFYFYCTGVVVSQNVKTHTQQAQAGSSCYVCAYGTHVSERGSTRNFAKGN